MIEEALVYIYSLRPARRFVGCGALIEGGYVATCRHVWRDATRQNPAEESPDVELEFPRRRDGGSFARRTATLADACEDESGSIDFVLLLPAEIPGGLMTLQLATKEGFETGRGQSVAGVVGLNRDRPGDLRTLFVPGRIAPITDEHGLRQFTGDNPSAYWFSRGSSGSPVFLDGGQQLAGIVAISDLGANKAAVGHHEAFVVPATTMRRHVGRLMATQVAQRQHLGRTDLQRILDQIGVAGDLPLVEIPQRLEQFVVAARQQAAVPTTPSNDGADIDAAIGSARRRLAALDAAAAKKILQEKIEAEEASRRQRLLPLLRERVEIELLEFDRTAAIATLHQIAGLLPEAAWVHGRIGECHAALGNSNQAMAAYRTALSISETLTRRDPANSAWQHNLAVSQEKVGDILLAQGDGVGALQAYRASLAVAEALARRDPANSARQRNLSVSQVKVGDALSAQGDRAGALQAYQVSLAISEALTLGDPANNERQRDLSVSRDKIGDVLLAQGDGAGALRVYRASLAIREALARRDPANSERQRDLSISQIKVGDVLLAQGDGAGALEAYRASLAIGEALARRDPANSAWQRDLSVSQTRLGDILRAQGDGAGALEVYRASLAIRETLARRDPSNSAWQRDLSVSQIRVGDGLRAAGDGAGALRAYRASGAIRETLVRGDPANSEWQSDLSVIQDRIGDVLLARNDLTDALEAYRASVAIRETLVRGDPANSEWQSDLSVNRDRIGDVLFAQGDRAGALEAYRASLAIREMLVHRDAANGEWQQELVFLNLKLAQCDAEDKLKHLRSALAIAEMLRDTNRLSAADYWMIDGIKAQLAVLENQ